ncbi:hypothetical protein SVAN01_02065 [Stagonosporopsis vannaccii]|nr:hypothetical protein SVAN01_02065 [Stagonosporopsis vannaccii]
MASANRASSAGPGVSIGVSRRPPPPPPPPSPPPSPPPPAASAVAAASAAPVRARGARRLIPCGTCVAALLVSSAAALCYDVVGAGQRAKRCFRCSCGHSCRPLPGALKPIGIELTEELVRSGGVTTHVNNLFIP